MQFRCFPSARAKANKMKEAAEKILNDFSISHICLSAVIGEGKNGKREKRGERTNLKDDIYLFTFFGGITF
jgi:hypothetical protein